MRLKETNDQEERTKKQVLEVLSALAEPTRLAAMCLVCSKGELCLCDIVEHLNVTQSRASRHMAVLVKAGLVLDRRDAQWVRYKKNTKLPKPLRGVVKSVLATLPSASPTKGKCYEKH